MSATIERVTLAVTFTVPGDDSLPDYRDTLYLEMPDDVGNAAQEAIQAEIDKTMETRHAAWADALLNPPPPIVDVELDALDVATMALEAAKELADKATVAIAEARVTRDQP